MGGAIDGNENNDLVISREVGYGWAVEYDCLQVPKIPKTCASKSPAFEVQQASGK